MYDLNASETTNTPAIDTVSVLPTSGSDKNSITDTCSYSANKYTSYLDTNLLSTGAMIYWQAFCDSMVLYFEDIQGKKKKLNSDEWSLDYLDGLGESFAKEYPKYCVFICEVISGCCTPPHIIFRDKKYGDSIGSIHSDLLISIDFDIDFAVAYKNANYEEVELTNLISNRKVTAKMPERMKQVLRDGLFVEPASMYDRGFVTGNKFYLPYRIQRREDDSWEMDTLIIRL